MILQSLWQAIEASSLGVFIAESPWAFPTIETIHVIAITTVLGTIAIVDLRLLGVASTSTAVTVLSRETLRWTWGAFLIAAITGSLLFVSKATSYMVNPYFLSKMVLIALAGLNMMVFHFLTWRSIATWDNDVALPTGAKVAGALSLLLWVMVAFSGRVIGFTLGIYY
jgi:hypothetical protein